MDNSAIETRLDALEILLQQLADTVARRGWVCSEGVSDMLQQTAGNCWEVALFNLCIRVDVLRRAVHPTMKSAIQKLLQNGETHCDLLPQVFFDWANLNHINNVKNMNPLEIFPHFLRWCGITDIMLPYHTTIQYYVEPFPHFAASIVFSIEQFCLKYRAYAGILTIWFTQVGQDEKKRVGHSMAFTICDQRINLCLHNECSSGSFQRHPWFFEITQTSHSLDAVIVYQLTMLLPPETIAHPIVDPRLPVDHKWWHHSWGGSHLPGQSLRTTR